jgi:class 3 adenylate cyclase
MKYSDDRLNRLRGGWKPAVVLHLIVDSSLGYTLNTASRMESTGEAGRIQVSEFFARALCLVPGASNESNPAPSEAPGTRHPALVERGTIDIKGKGTMTTYWLEHT